MKDELVIFTKPKSHISEDIRTVRTNLQFTSVDEESKVLLVTSSVPGEGKSFISSNLSAALAQNGKKVLLIDSDLRLGRLHKVFGLSNLVGFSNLLIDRELDNYAEYIQKTDVEGLYVIPRGVVPPNPTELLNSSNTKKILSTLKKKFDYIVLDTPPVNLVPDTLVLATAVDRVVIVAAAKYTKIDELDKTKKALEKVDTLIIGGMDRGIDYKELIDFLNKGNVENIICMPTTGHDIAKALINQKTYIVETLEEAVKIAKDVTKKEGICLLSPAAASYGFFKNFEERGDMFQKYVKE